MKLTFEQKYQLLFEISHKTRDTFELDDIMGQLLDTLNTVVPYDAAGIFVLSQEMIDDRQVHPTHKIAGMCWRGYDPQPTGDDMLIHGKGIIGHVIDSKSSLIVPDVHLDERYIKARRQTQSEIAVPILRDERSIGAVNLESDQLNAYNESDLEVLQFFADAASIALEKALLHRQLLEKELLDKQLQIAREMQMHLLPIKDPSIPGYDIAGICIPAGKIGGDYYDYLKLSDGNLGIVVADVSGHGIDSALAMTAFRGLLRTQTQGKFDPASIARMINNQIPDFTGDSHFITMVLGILDPQNDEVIFVSCGHPSPRLLHTDGSSESLQSNGPAFGIYSKVDYVNETKNLSHGDILVMYTDGVVDIENPDGEPFGIERLKKLVTKYTELTVKEMIQKIIRETQAHSGYLTYQDDFTLVIVKKG